MKLYSYLPQRLKNLIKHHLVGPEVPQKFQPTGRIHFSQGGEDTILLQILRNYGIMKPNGFFVDVGAYHPFLDSNTYILYTRGWRGINIDARPNSMKDFNVYRPEDINLEIGISSEHIVLDYYFFDDNSTMNSFSKEYLESIGMMKHVAKVLKVNTSPLKEILENQPIPSEGIDYLNIDAEGLDLEVINSNDFERFRPKVVSVEVSPINTLDDVSSNEIYKELERLGYVCVAKNFILKSVGTLFFVDKAFNI